jgi:hypothetical protein
VVRVSPHHQLTLFGGEDGHVDAWDPRTRRALARLDVGSHVLNLFPEYAPAPVPAYLSVCLPTHHGPLLSTNTQTLTHAPHARIAHLV